MKESARIQFTSEELVSLTQATRALPRGRNGKRLHVATLHRWAGCGLRGVVLDTIRVGGRRYTSTEALQRFFDCLTAQGRSGRADLSAADEGRLARAEKELDRRGV